MIRKLLHGFLAFLYPTLVISGVIGLSLIFVFGNSKPIKGAFDKSGIYSAAVGSALSNIQKNTEVNNINLGDPGIKMVVQKTLTPTYLQTNSEKIIDSLYDWLNGKTKTPQFGVDLTKIKSDLATNLGTYATQRLATLPACPKGSDPHVDPLATNCVPAGFDMAAAPTQVQNQVLESTDFLNQKTFTVNDLKDDQGQSVINKYQALPTAFMTFKYSSWITAVLALLCGVGVVLLAESKRRGLRTVAITSAVCGFLILVMAWGGDFATNRIVAHLATDPGADVLKVNVADIAHILASDIFTWWFWLGGVLAVFGVVTVAVLHFTGPRLAKPKKEKEDELPTSLPPYLQDETHTSESKKSDSATKIATAKPKSTPKKVNISG